MKVLAVAQPSELFLPINPGENGGKSAHREVGIFVCAAGITARFFHSDAVPSFEFGW